MSKYAKHFPAFLEYEAEKMEELSFESELKERGVSADVIKKGRYIPNQERVKREILQLLTPAYDLLNVSIANPKDKEELALPIAGRKTRLDLNDFLTAGKKMGLEENVVVNLVVGLQRAFPRWQELIHSSFLSEDMRKAYEELHRYNRRFALE